MTTIPRRPVNRAIPLADHLEYEFALFRLRLRDSEGVLDHFGSLLESLLTGVVKPTQNGARVYLVAGLDLEDDAHRRIDLVFSAFTASTHHLRGQADVLSVNGAHVSAAR